MQISEIQETIKMIDEECLDIRTITMGISLLDCIDPDIDTSCRKCEEKICRLAKDLVRTGDEIARTYGIPVVNKRISVTPIAFLVAASGGDPVKYAHMLERCARRLGVDFIGGYSALVQKGYAHGDRELIDSIPRALKETQHVCASVNIGSTKAGINMDAVKRMGEVIREAAELTADDNCIGAAKLVVFCNAVEDNPFMAGAFHGVGEGDCVINVGVSGPGVVRAALAKAPKDAPIDRIADLIKRTAFKITRMGQLVGTVASEKLGVPFGIVDLSLAPTPAVGDSVAHILEEMGLETCGAYGTTAALAMLNDAVKKGGVMATSHVGGLSGAFIPVSEDAGMIDAARQGVLKLEKLEAMTAVCSVGLDMIVIPGETRADIISGIIADEAAIGMVNTKTTAVRLIPAIGKSIGETLDFGGLLGEGPVMPVNQTSDAVFINRGGRIPAPLQALKN
ncbi:PFL family protein [uncultured Faecalibaculum sp.]|uniref:PFL family protein n=3 Tax=uncultured Faecalibaculum sp. TaxID=1729681 RepID=UPI002622B504|nr:PFL family protein [uncultured Faecalibaculum sp.]